MIAVNARRDKDLREAGVHLSGTWRREVMAMADWLRCGLTGIKRAPVQSQGATQLVLMTALVGTCAVTATDALATAGNENLKRQTQMEGIYPTPTTEAALDLQKKSINVYPK